MVFIIKLQFKLFPTILWVRTKKNTTNLGIIITMNNDNYFLLNENEAQTNVRNGLHFRFVFLILFKTCATAF